MDATMKEILQTRSGMDNLIKAGMQELMEKNIDMTEQEAFKIARQRLLKLREEAGLI